MFTYSAIDFVLIIILFLSLWYWWESMQCREIARRSGKQACTNADVQFLDDTVSQVKMWLRKTPTNGLELCRLYMFEFASDGEHRYQGRIVIIGKHVAEIEMDVYRP